MGTESVVDRLGEQVYGRFFAEAGYEMAQSTAPNPSRIALHQAHLATPIARKIDHTGQESSDVRLYQYLSSFAMNPSALGSDHSFHTWQFNVSTPDWERRVTTANDATKIEPARRLYIDGSCIYRLRCAYSPPTFDHISESEWTVKENIWPSSCFISCNDVPLEVRRKHHHGKDLALDLTGSIREGINTITFSILRNQDECVKKFYAVAVELVEIGDELRVQQAVMSVTAEASLRSMTDTLNGVGDDDDLCVLDPHLSIDLIDPFTAEIFQIPVRGRCCTHRECFDLYTFLHTRKSRVSGGPTSADEWRCPICRLDARPASLVRDEFLQTVRQELENRSALGVKAIFVNSDGTWDIKKADNDGNQRRRGTSKTVHLLGSNVKGETKTSIESTIIELDASDDND